MADAQGTDEGKKKVMETILSLTLEIIFLLTGEDYTAVVKISGDHVTPVSQSNAPRECKSPMIKLTSHSLIPEDNTSSKILAVINKIIELLTGEVPIRCQDVTVYFSMEEWEYLEGHKDLYKDVIMEKRPPLTSPDGSSNRNTPERCPRPLYSRDYTQEDQEMIQEHQEVPQEQIESLQDDQDNGLTVVEVGDAYVSDDYPCKEEEEEIQLVKIKEEEIPAEISSDGQYDRDGMDTQHSIYTDVEVENEVIKLEISEKNFITPDPTSDPQTSSCTSFAESSSTITHRTVGERFPCPDCRKCFKSRGELIVHRKSHPGAKQYSCPQCGKGFIYKSSLGRHVRVHTGEKPYTCSECGKSFSQRNSLFTHERTHTGAKPYTCSVCGKSFRQSSALSTHERTHTGEKPYSCSVCGKCFRQSSALYTHEKTHTSDKPFSCSECDKCFTEKGNLITHMRSHTGEKPFSCSECGKSFSRSSGLIKHQRCHTGEKPFSCFDCGRCFNDRSDLAKHRRIHTGERPYLCTECGKGFSLKSHLLRHKAVHTSYQPYSCSECGKRFTDKSNLVRHVRVHTGNRPYSCSECGKEYSHKSSLLSHANSHRKEVAIQ